MWIAGIQYFTDNRDLAFAWYFTAKPPRHRPEKLEGYTRFRQALIHIGYKVIDKEVRVIEDKESNQIKLKGNLDIEMAFKMLSGVPHYDEAVVLGGDSDFIPIFQYLVNLGKTVVCVGRKASTSLDLINAATKFIDLENIKDRIEKKIREGR